MRAIVLMSTYNGAAYLEPQIRSILDQDFPDVTLMIRDDGSCDATPDILRRLAKADPRIELRFARNVGLPHAYFELLRECPVGAGLYLFSDQDDIWDPDKIAAAARQLQNQSSQAPFLYCSRARLMTPDETIIGVSPPRPHPPAFGNALIENICTGCTTAFNGALLKRLLQTKTFDGIMYHDWWAYLVATAFGTVIFDRVAHIDYRLHENNVAGMPTSRRNAFSRRMTQQRVGERFANLLAQAEAFAIVYGEDLTPAARQLLGRLLALKDNRRAAWGLVNERAIFRQSPRDDLVWRMALSLHGAGLIDTR